MNDPIVSYRRVSTVEQDIGLQAQQTAIQQWCDSRGLAVGTDFVEKESARTLARPQLQLAIGWVEQTKGTLIVAKLDRLSRSVADFASLVERANKNGWKIVVCDLNIDMTTPSGRLIANIMASLAEWERSMIGLRIKEAMAEKRKQGIYPGRPVNDTLVTMIRGARASGMSLHAIADRLNEDAVPTAAGGKRWYASTVRSVLGRAS